MGHIKFH